MRLVAAMKRESTPSCREKSGVGFSAAMFTDRNHSLCILDITGKHLHKGDCIRGEDGDYILACCPFDCDPDCPGDELFFFLLKEGGALPTAVRPRGLRYCEPHGTLWEREVFRRAVL